MVNNIIIQALSTVEVTEKTVNFNFELKGDKLDVRTMDREHLVTFILGGVQQFCNDNEVDFKEVVKVFFEANQTIEVPVAHA